MLMMHKLFFCYTETVAMNLDPDQAQQHVGSDLDPNILTLMVFLKEIFEKKKILIEISRQTKKHA